MRTKESVKNIINCSHHAICTIIYNKQKNIHNRVKLITLETSKSLALPIYENQN